MIMSPRKKSTAALSAIDTVPERRAMLLNSFTLDIFLKVYEL